MSDQTKNLRKNIQGLSEVGVIQQDQQDLNRHDYCLVAWLGKAQCIKGLLDDGLKEKLVRVFRFPF